MRQLHQSLQNEKHLKLSGSREWYKFVFGISSKTNETPVTQEVYLDEKQCLMFRLLLAASTAVKQGVLS